MKTAELDFLTRSIVGVYTTSDPREHNGHYETRAARVPTGMFVNANTVYISTDDVTGPSKRKRLVVNVRNARSAAGVTRAL